MFLYCFPVFNLIDLIFISFLTVSLTVNCCLYDFVFKFQLQIKLFVAPQILLECGPMLNFQQIYFFFDK